MLVQDVTFRRLAAVLHYTQFTVLATLLVAVLVIWRLADEVQAADIAVRTSHDVIAELTIVRKKIQSAEIALRNFDVTGRDAFLESVRAGCGRALAASDRLAEHVVNRGADRTFAQAVARETRKAIAWLENAATAGAIDGQGPVHRILVYRVEQHDMEALAYALDAMEKGQGEILARRMATQDRRMSELKATEAVAAAALALIAAWSIVYARGLMKIGSAKINDLKLDAERDPLTGLLNRRALGRRLDKVGADQALAVLALDLDDFKPINDVYGHAAGDAVLSALAKRLVGICRGHDIAARTGGDEFVVVLFGVSDLAGVAVACARIRASLQEPIPLKNASAARVGVSVGCALRGVDGMDLASLLSIADQRSYSEKAQRKGQLRARAAPATPQAIS